MLIDATAVADHTPVTETMPLARVVSLASAPMPHPHAFTCGCKLQPLQNAP